MSTGPKGNRLLALVMKTGLRLRRGGFVWVSENLKSEGTLVGTGDGRLGGKREMD